MNSSDSSTLSSEPVDVLIITAADLEDKAVRQVGDGAIGPWLEVDLGEAYQFPVWQRGYRSGAGRELRIALSGSWYQGIGSAGHAAASLARLLKPKCLAMCGVCAGNPWQTQLGDVIVADRVWDYEAGVIICSGGDTDPVFQPDIMTYLLRPSWAQAAKDFRPQSCAQWLGMRPRPRDLQELWVLRELLEHRDPLDSPDQSTLCAEWTTVIQELEKSGQVQLQNGIVTLMPRGEERIRNIMTLYRGELPQQEDWKICVGPMATGSKLVKNLSIWDTLANQERHVIGLDMEASVIGLTAHIEEVPMIVVKGVMDYANPDRTQNCRIFAARAAAEVLIGFLREQLEGRSKALRVPHKLPPRNDRFVGREGELARLHSMLNGVSATGVPRQVALCGHGGLGKSALAIEYAWQSLSVYPSGVFYVRGGQKNLETEIAAIGVELGLPEQETPELSARAVARYLKNAAPSLLIVDDVNDIEYWTILEQSAEFLPGGNCRRLLTTPCRDQCVMGSVHLDRLPWAQCVLLLAQYREDAGCVDNQEFIRTIVDWVDGLPVALTTIGTYMAWHKDLSWKDYAENLATTASESDIHKRTQCVYDDLVGALPTSRRRALEYAALLPEGEIVTNWLVDLLESDPEMDLAEPGYQQHPARAPLHDLLSTRLLRCQGDSTQIVTMAPLLRCHVNDKLEKTPKLRSTLRTRIVSFAESWSKRVQSALVNRGARAELTPLLGLFLCLIHWNRREEALRVANWLHTPLYQLGRFPEDQQLMRKAVKLGQAIPKHQAELAIAYSNLAGTEEDLGHLDEAKELLLAAIRIEEAILEHDDPPLATSYSNLACVEYKLGNLDKAFELVHRALTIDEQCDECDPRTLATRYSILGLLERERGDLERAEGYLRRAVDLRRKATPAACVPLADDLSNLGLLLLDQEHLEEARQSVREAVEFWEKVYENGHPKLATGYSNLAAIEHALGARGDRQQHLEESRRLQKRAIRIWASAFPPDHPILVSAYSNYAILLKDLGELKEALQWVQEAIRIQEQANPHAPELAQTYEIQQRIRYIELKRLLSRAFEISNTCFGPDHRCTKQIQEALALLDDETGRRES